jgi:hypothetical protein
LLFLPLRFLLRFLLLLLLLLFQPFEMEDSAASGRKGDTARKRCEKGATEDQAAGRRRAKPAPEKKKPS